MKAKAIIVIVGSISLLVVLFVIMFSVRWFNATTVQNKIIKPKDGIECVVVTATDGVAVDCWRTQND